MIRSSVVSRVSETEQGTGMECLDEAAVLAAVMAASLVEYRGQLERRAATNGSRGAQDTWRMLACLDRLQGKA